jgi:outer membrane protein assembly factor BamA
MKTLVLPVVFLINLIFLPHSIRSQNPIKVKYNALPIVFYSPETGLALGALANANFYLQDSSYRPSILLFGGAYTLKNQLLLYLPFEFNWNQNSTITKGELGYYRYFYNFYGIGPDASDEFEIYTVNFPRLRINTLYRFWGNHFGGLRISVDDYRIQNIDGAGQLLNKRIPGYQGSLISTTGLVYAFDSRDSNINPHEGWFITLNVDYNGELFGSNFEFSRITVDAMKYINTGHNNILALNFYGGQTLGNVPFQELMLYGSGNKGRGYYFGRFRDNVLMMLQAEYRVRIWRRFGGTIFGTLGNVSNSIESFDVLTPKYNIGLGLRYLINPADRLNIRVDYAIGKNTSGFYLTFGEAF